MSGRHLLFFFSFLFSLSFFLFSLSFFLSSLSFFISPPLSPSPYVPSTSARYSSAVIASFRSLGLLMWILSIQASP